MHITSKLAFQIQYENHTKKGATKNMFHLNKKKISTQGRVSTHRAKLQQYETRDNMDL